MSALDRSRPFGSVNNDREGRFFEQDGVFFGADGALWHPAAPDAAAVAGAPAPRLAKGKAAPAEISAVDAQIDAQLGMAPAASGGQGETKPGAAT